MEGLEEHLEMILSVVALAIAGALREWANKRKFKRERARADQHAAERDAAAEAIEVTAVRDPGTGKYLKTEARRRAHAKGVDLTEAAERATKSVNGNDA